jgi:hypothetical protein
MAVKPLELTRPLRSLALRFYGVWGNTSESTALQTPLEPGLRRDDGARLRPGERSYTTTSGAGCPSGAAEHRRENRIKLAPCLSVIERSEIASCASAGFPEKRRTSVHKSQIYVRTSHRVPFSLGTFSWASKRKCLARRGETQRRMILRKKKQISVMSGFTALSATCSPVQASPVRRERIGTSAGWPAGLNPDSKQQTRHLPFQRFPFYPNPHGWPYPTILYR